MTQSLCKIRQAAYTEGECERVQERQDNEASILFAHQTRSQGTGASAPLTRQDRPYARWAPGIPMSQAGGCPIAMPLQATLIQTAIYGAVGVFSVICLNGLYFWSANFENFFNRKFLFFFSLFSISCLKSQPHVKTLTLTFNDFHFHSNSLIHLTSLLLAYFSCTHTSTFYQCSMAFRGTALWSHTNCHAVTTIIEPSALRFFSSRRKETVVVCLFFF